MFSFPLRPDQTRPHLGSLVAIKPTSDEPLAGVPGRISAVVQRVRSGDYLVTVRYDEPQRVDHTVLSELDVFLSELDLVEHTPARHYPQ